MKITIYKNFRKRRNSTKIPSGGTEIDVALKESTSIDRPTFVFNSNEFDINYVKAFGKYYYVDDVKSVRNSLIEVSCEIDPGATFRSNILGYTAFVERSYSYRNIMIPDPYVAMLNHETVKESLLSPGVFDSTGFYVVSVLNDLGSNAGFCTYYCISVGMIKSLANYINHDWGSGVSDFLQWLQATFLHTADAIIDCIWMPLQWSNLPASPLSLETVKVGVDNVTGVTAYRFTGAAIYYNTWSIPIPHDYDDFRKGAPYTTAKLYVFGYGMIDINPLDFPNDTIYISMSVDLATGDTILELNASNGSQLVACYTYNIAVPCPVGHVTQGSASGAAGGVLSTAGAIAGAIAAPAGAATAAASVGAVASGVNTLSSMIQPTMSVRGGKGGRAMIYQDPNIRLSLLIKSTTDPDDLKTTQGSIFMKEIQLNMLSGYVKCSNADVPITGTKIEKDAVNALLNGGFYIE